MLYYYGVLGLQAFCIYHCYRNRSDTYWYFIILFLPLIGGLVYLFTHVLKRNMIEKAGNEVVHSLDSGKVVRDLEKKLRFADTYENRVALADAYMSKGWNKEAIEHYQHSISEMFSSDFHVHNQLVKANYALGHTEEVLKYAKVIEQKPEFRKSEASWCYAKSLISIGKIKEGEQYLRGFDTPFDNFGRRLELAQFLSAQDRQKEAVTLLDELLSEGEHLSGQNARKNRAVMKQILDYRTELMA